MSVAANRPCSSWNLSATGCGTDLVTLIGAEDPGVVNRIIGAVEQYLYMETGKRFTGTCSGVIAPPPLTASCWTRLDIVRNPNTPYGNVWDRLDIYNILGQHVENVNVTGVTVDGAVLVPDVDWAFVGGRYLVALAGGALDPWPNQDPNKLLGDPGTWSISFTSGYMPTDLVLTAGSELLCEVFRSHFDLPCDVPKNAVSVRRDGVSITIAPGYKGLPMVAAALAAYPKHRRRRPRLYDPRSIASAHATRQ
jgi:hypothetical protein